MYSILNLWSWQLSASISIRSLSISLLYLYIYEYMYILRLIFLLRRYEKTIERINKHRKVNGKVGKKERSVEQSWYWRQDNRHHLHNVHVKSLYAFKLSNSCVLFFFLVIYTYLAAANEGGKSERNNTTFNVSTNIARGYFFLSIYFLPVQR